MIINGVKYVIKKHQDDGSLPYLFMLHGFMGDGRVFQHMIDDLRNACNPVTIDLLGHGRSEKVHDPDRYREERQIADIIQIVEQLSAGSGIKCSNYASSGTEINNNVDAGPEAGVSAKASACTNTGAGAHITSTPNLPLIYGYSMGGRLALKTALEAPELLGGLILESTNPGLTDDAKRADRRAADTQRARQIKEDYPAFLGEWEQLPLFKSPLKTDKKLENRYKEIHLAQDPETMAASLLGFGTGSMKPVLPDAITNYKNPAIIIAGTGDQKYMNIGQPLASYFSEGSFCPVPAGHRVHLDNPAALTEKISRFIDESLMS